MEYRLGRPEMEEKYGPLGSGGRTIDVGGMTHTLRAVLARWSLDLPDIMTVDGGVLGEDRYWIRFFDRDDRRYAVFEFNGRFDILSEMRADSLAWEGDEFFRSRTA